MPTNGTSRTSEERATRLAESKATILASGLYRTVNQALRAVDLDRTTYSQAIGDGLSENPKTKTVEKLRKLGVLDIATRV